MSIPQSICQSRTIATCAVSCANEIRSLMDILDLSIHPPWVMPGISRYQDFTQQGSRYFRSSPFHSCLFLQNSAFPRNGTILTKAGIEHTHRQIRVWYKCIICIVYKMYLAVCSRSLNKGSWLHECIWYSMFMFPQYTFSLCGISKKSIS